MTPTLATIPPSLPACKMVGWITWARWSSAGDRLFPTVAALRELRAFLHRMGREANEGKIGLVLDGHYIGITEFEEVRS